MGMITIDKSDLLQIIEEIEILNEKSGAVFELMEANQEAQHHTVGLIPNLGGLLRDLKIEQARLISELLEEIDGL